MISVTNLSLNCTNKNGISFKGVQAPPKFMYFITKNNVDAFDSFGTKIRPAGKNNPAKSVHKESFFEIVREILGEMFPKWDPDFKKIYGKIL